MAVVLVGNSLLIQAALVVCFINTGIQTAFQLDEFGDVVFKDPAIAGSEDYHATEGNYGFCCVSFRYYNLLNSFSFLYPKAFLLVLYFSWLAFPPWGAWFKVPSLPFQVFFVVDGRKKVIIYAGHNGAAPGINSEQFWFLKFKSPLVGGLS